MIRRTFLSLVALCAAAIPASSAVLTTYTNSATFNSALSSQTLVNFNELVQHDSLDSAGITSGGVNFVGVNGGFFQLTSQQPAVGSATDWGTGTYLLLPYYFGASSYTTVTLPSSVTAVAFDFGTKSTTGKMITVTIAGVPVTINTASFPAHTFFAVTSDTGFTTLQISSNGNNFPTLDNFVFGTANVTVAPADTPEVTTLLMIASGLFMMRYGGRRFGRSAATSA